ncbi:MAG: ZIP family metal transporter [Thermoanaerobacteraceae bacterium]|nr:ZIP family metal transporter [Thermoanaerobacteraceae bacterium]
MAEFLHSYNIIALGLLASLAAGLATGVGATPIFFTRNIPKNLLDVLLGFAAGVMLAATSFSLIIPALEGAGGGVKAAAIVLGGILIGGVFLDKVDTYFPDTNLMKGPRRNHNNLRRAWLFVAAITIHNFPEGLAVGVGFGIGNIANGLSLAIAIGLQNIPEGLAVALPLLREGLSTWKVFLIALATGLVEPIGGLLGVGLVQITAQLLPWALAFAAGAMLFVISHEIIPEAQKNSASKAATHALLLGFVIMMFLDNVLG